MARGTPIRFVWHRDPSRSPLYLAQILTTSIDFSKDIKGRLPRLNPGSQVRDSSVTQIYERQSRQKTGILAALPRPRFLHPLHFSLALPTKPPSPFLSCNFDTSQPPVRTCFVVFLASFRFTETPVVPVVDVFAGSCFSGVCGGKYWTRYYKLFDVSIKILLWGV